MELLNRLTEFVEKHRDPRSREWFLANSSPLACVSLMLVYILTVKFFLPAYMKNRAPYKLTNVLLYYNIFQVLLSLYMVYLSYWSGYIRRFSIWGCRDLDRSTTDPDALMAARSVYIFYMAKFTEFLDTIFFVLRKKEKQVSFLHVYHHASMVFNMWLGVVFCPGGSAAMVVGTNSSIHVVMYMYYLLTAMGPKWQKYLWWKKYLTRFQIIQFIYGLIQCILSFANFDTCPELMKIWPIVTYFFFYILSLLYLFTKFYIQEYKPKPQHSKGQ